MSCASSAALHALSYLTHSSSVAGRARIRDPCLKSGSSAGPPRRTPRRRLGYPPRRGRFGSLAQRRPPARAVLFFPALFSTRTPLNFFAAFFFPAGFLTAMNSPDFLLRLVHAVAPPRLALTCDRFFTAPLRALSPTGLLTATLILPLLYIW